MPDLRFVRREGFDLERAVEIAERRVRPAAVAQSQRRALAGRERAVERDLEQTVGVLGAERAAVGRGHFVHAQARIQREQHTAEALLRRRLQLDDEIRREVAAGVDRHRAVDRNDVGHGLRKRAPRARRAIARCVAASDKRICTTNATDAKPATTSADRARDGSPRLARIEPRMDGGRDADQTETDRENAERDATSRPATGAPARSPRETPPARRRGNRNTPAMVPGTVNSPQ